MVRILIFLAKGFEEIEMVTVADILRRAEVNVTIASLSNTIVKGAHNIKILADKSINDIDISDFDAVVIPGGSPGYTNLRKDQRVINIIKKAFNSNKIVAAICAASTVLSDAGILKGKMCTIYPGMEIELRKGGGKSKDDNVVVDGNIITSKGPATTISFALKLVEKTVGKDVAKSISKKLLVNKIQ